MMQVIRADGLSDIATVSKGVGLCKWIIEHTSSNILYWPWARMDMFCMCALPVLDLFFFSFFLSAQITHVCVQKSRCAQTSLNQSGMWTIEVYFPLLHRQTSVSFSWPNIHVSLTHENIFLTQPNICQIFTTKIPISTSHTQKKKSLQHVENHLPHFHE